MRKLTEHKCVNVTTTCGLSLFSLFLQTKETLIVTKSPTKKTTKKKQLQIIENYFKTNSKITCII
jgi:hypothetical protein